VIYLDRWIDDSEDHAVKVNGLLLPPWAFPTPDVLTIASVAPRPLEMRDVSVLVIDYGHPAIAKRNLNHGLILQGVAPG
jgi:hypothetical protein